MIDLEKKLSEFFRSFFLNANENSLKFSLKFEDERQPYHTNHGYVLNIG